MFILLLRRLLSNICEMAIDCHDGRSCRMSATIRRAVILLSNALWRVGSDHDGGVNGKKLRESLLGTK